MSPLGCPEDRDRRQLEAAQGHSDIVPASPPLGTSAAPVWRVVRLAVALAAPSSGTDQLVHALRLLASPTSFEPGCLGCRVWTEDNDESTVRYVEEWATEDAMRLRVRSRRFTRLLEVLESAPMPPRVEFDFVTETRGLDYVAEVRERDRKHGTALRDTME